jgi:Zn-dependent proteases
MFGNPQSSSLDIRFALFGIPVAITPFFWLIGCILAYNFAYTDNRLDALAFLASILAILLSILTHEFGHALVIRYVFGASPVVVLHGLGGVTIHDRPYYYRTPQRLGRIFISFAGPMAGFLLAAICCFPLLAGLISPETYLSQFLSVMVYIGIFWGIFNLMPVYPLDGGQIFREVSLAVSPRYGLQFSAGVSAVVAILLALLFFRLGSIFIPFLFGFLAYQSIQTLQSRRP